MFIMYFTEQPMSAYPEEEARKRDGLTVLRFSNEFYDAEAGSAIYQDRLAEYKLVDEVGFDGVMLNEHHNAPFCMQPQIQIWASVLAAVTRNVRIVLLGVPLPLRDNPVATAEELAMIDMISQGRLVPGLIRGGGTEQFAMNANPAYNRDRLEEAHDLIIKTWTTPGPFRWEGDQYHFRVVNPWALPVQKPHPRIWVPGTSSLETVQWAAAHRYPYIGLGTDEKAQKRIMGAYKEVAAQKGYEVGSWNFGQTIHFHVQDTMEHAMRNAREFMWMAGEFTGLGHPVWSSPSGYLWGAPDSPAAIARRRGAVARNNSRAGAKGLRSAGGGADTGATLQKHLDDLTWIMGDPDHAVAQLRKVLETTRPGIVSFYATDGRISHRDNMRNIELIGKRVIPAMREMAEELDLRSPFEVDAPISLAATPAEDLRPYEYSVEDDPMFAGAA